MLDQQGGSYSALSALSHWSQILGADQHITGLSQPRIRDQFWCVLATVAKFYTQPEVVPSQLL